MPDNCEPCRSPDTCLTFPLIFYNLNDGKFYSNNPMIVQVTCPDGTVQSVTIAAGEITFTLPFPVGYTGEYPPLVLPCEDGVIVRSIPSGSDQTAIDVIVAEMFQTCAETKARARACSTSFGNDQVVFDTGCAAGETVVFSGTLPSWITLDTTNNQLIGAAGTFSATTIVEATAIAQAQINAFGTQQIALGNLTCATATCVAADGSIAVNPTVSLAISSNPAIRRMMSTSFVVTGLDVIDTATDTVIMHTDPGIDVGYPVFAGSNNTFWIQQINGDQLFKYDSDGNLLSTITPSPGDVFNAPMAYESTTGKVYFTLQGADFIVYEIDPVTNAVVVGQNFGPPAVPAAIFATPGVIFVAAVPPTADSSFFDLYSVPGYAHIGQIATNAAANQQAFCYDPDNGKAYISGFNGVSGNTEIYEITPATATVDFTYDVSATCLQIASMAYDPVHQRIFAIDEFNGVGLVINPSTRSIICTLAAPAFTFPSDAMVADPVSGSFYISDSFAATPSITKWT